MIWPLCFIFIPHLFEIHLFSSSTQYPFHRQDASLSWTDDSRHRLVTGSDTSQIHIERCTDPVPAYRTATCASVPGDFNGSYRCHPSRGTDLPTRQKRDAEKRSRRISYILLLLMTGVACFIIGVMAGMSVSTYILTRRRARESQRSTSSKPFTPIGYSPTLKNDVGNVVYGFHSYRTT